MTSTAFLILGVLGLAARFGLAVVFFGTNDMEGWTAFGSSLSHESLCDVYPNVIGMGGQFNHPPLMGVLAGSLWSLSVRMHVPFYLLFKLVPVVADCGTAVLLFGIFRRRNGERAAAGAFAAYGWSLVSLLIAGVHGNTDAIGVFFSVLALDFFERARPISAGLALAAAINVKLIPIVLVIAVVVQVRDKATLVRLGFGFVLGLLPFSLVSDCHRAFLDKVVAYVPHHDSWGLPYFLSLAGQKRGLVHVATTLASRYDAVARYVPLLGALVVAVWTRRHRGSVFVAGALTFAVFLLGAAGFGVQYLIYLAPMLFVADRRLGALYATASGIFVACVYLPFVSWKTPYLIHMFGRIGPGPAKVGALVWGIIALSLAVLLRQGSSVHEPIEVQGR